MNYGLKTSGWLGVNMGVCEDQWSQFLNQDYWIFHRCGATNLWFSLIWAIWGKNVQTQRVIFRCIRFVYKSF